MEYEVLPSDDVYTSLDSNRSLAITPGLISERLIEDYFATANRTITLTRIGREVLYLLEQLSRRGLPVSEIQEIEDDKVRRKILDAMSKAKTIEAPPGPPNVDA